MKTKKAIELDGRTGEGGGQLVRIAAALAAVTSQPVRITHVRGNREGPRGGGLKAQHVSSLRWLVEATDAEVDGLSIGSHVFEFRPSKPPTAALVREERRIKIVADSSAASTLLIFQAVFPYLLFAGNDAGEAIELEIEGGTNVAFSLSYEYLDQVLLPTLQQRFGVSVERKLRKRGWSVGPKSSNGCICFKIQPIPPGQSLKPENAPLLTADDFKIKRIDATIVAPYAMHQPLQEMLVKDLDVVFPDVDITFPTLEESGHDARIYVLLVAHSATGNLRWGRDCLYGRSVKKKKAQTLSNEVSRQVCKDLFDEITVRGMVDEHLQDQLVIFQALAQGLTSFHRGVDPADAVMANQQQHEQQGDQDTDGLDLAISRIELDGNNKKMRRDKTIEPFGEGSAHTTTARWVASELLPHAKWFNKGSICEGVGISFDQSKV